MSSGQKREKGGKCFDITAGVKKEMENEGERERVCESGRPKGGTKLTNQKSRVVSIDNTLWVGVMIIFIFLRTWELALFRLASNYLR